MADKSWILRVELENGQPVIRQIEDMGNKGEAAARKIKRANEAEATPAMRGYNAAVTEGAQALDRYVQRAGPFGSVLASMGKGGYAAAAGIGALTAATVLLSGKVASTLNAMDDLADKGQRLQISVESLQALRLAARDAGFELEQGDAAAQAIRDARMSALSGTKGSKKSLQLFAAFGISKSELLQLSDVEGLLNRISQGAKAMGNDMVAAAKMSKLGLDPLKELLLGMPSDIEAATEALKAQGVIIDRDVVRKGAEANAQWELMATKIDVALTPAFVQLAEVALPVLQKILELLAEIVKAIPVAMNGFAAAWAFASGDLMGGARALQSAIGVAANGAARDSMLYKPGEAPTISTADDADWAMLRAGKPRNQFVPGEDGEDTESEAAATRALASAAREYAAAERLVLEVKGKEAQINARLKETIEGLNDARRRGIITSDDELAALVAKATAEANSDIKAYRKNQKNWFTEAAASAVELVKSLDLVDARQEGINLRLGIMNQLLSGSINSAGDLLDLFVKIVAQIAQMAAQMSINGQGSFFSNFGDIIGGLLGFGGGSSAIGTVNAFAQGTGASWLGIGGGRAGGGPTEPGMIYRWQETNGEDYIVSNRAGFVRSPHAASTMASRSAAEGGRFAGMMQPVLVSSVVENHGPPMEQKTETQRGADNTTRIRTILKPIVTDIQKDNIQNGRTDSALRARTGLPPRVMSR